MLELRRLPQNKNKFTHLARFAYEILNICQQLGIESMLSGSLAVFAYTQDEATSVNDIDLSCKECESARIIENLKNLGIAYELKEWHVLQVIKDDLKVEFDSMEYLMKDMPEDHEVLVTDYFTIKVVNIDNLS